MMKRNITGKAGFTLAETLLATLLLLIASALLVTGIPVAFRAYKTVTLTAEANVLISTTMTELKDKLAFCEDLAITGKKISFTSNNGRQYTLSYDADKAGLYLLDTTDNDYNPEKEENVYVHDSQMLVSDEAAVRELCVDYSEVKIDGNVLTFKDLNVYRKSDIEHTENNALVKIPEFDVRLLMSGE